MLKFYFVKLYFSPLKTFMRNGRIRSRIRIRTLLTNGSGSGFGSPKTRGSCGSGSGSPTLLKRVNKHLLGPFYLRPTANTAKNLYILKLKTYKKKYTNYYDFSISSFSQSSSQSAYSVNQTRSRFKIMPTPIRQQSKHP